MLISVERPFQKEHSCKLWELYLYCLFVCVKVECF